MRPVFTILVWRSLQKSWSRIKLSGFIPWNAKLKRFSYVPTKISLDMYYIIVGMKFKENNDLFLIIYKSCKK